MSSPAGISLDTGKRVALLAGATGLVGGRLLRLLLESPEYSRVHALSRRPLPFDHARLANRIMPLEGVESRLGGLRCQDAFCCIGTTRRQAGSDAELRRVDLDLALEFARAARACGAQRLVVISSVGADTASKVHYLRVKGELQERLKELQLPSLALLQPGVLLAWRHEFRPLEALAVALMPLVNPLLKGRHAVYRGMTPGDVAWAMLEAARTQRRGAHVYAGESLAALAQAGKGRRQGP